MPPFLYRPVASPAREKKMSKKSVSAPAKALSRKQLSRREKEARAQKQLILGTAAVLALVVLLLAWGLYDQYVLRPRRPVATVAGVPIRLDAYQRLVQYRRWDYRNYLNQLEAQKQQFAADKDAAFLVQYMDQQIQQVQNGLMNLPWSVLDELIDEQIIRQECQRRGITVTAEEVQARLEEQFGYQRNPSTPEPTAITATVPITVTPTPTLAPMTYEEFTQRSTNFFQQAREQTGFSEQEFRRLVETSLYREKLEAALKAEVPATAEQVHARHILFKTREEAEKALERLKNGEDFAALAQELSQDTATKDQGGDLGWFPRGQMEAAFEEAAFALQPGQLSEIIETSYGFHLILVEERDANRPLEGTALEDAQAKAISEWFAARRASPDVVRSWDSTMIPKDKTTQR